MKLLDVVHPAAKTLVDISLSQDAEVSTQCSASSCLVHKSRNSLMSLHLLDLSHLVVLF